MDPAIYFFYVLKSLLMKKKFIKLLLFIACLCICFNVYAQQPAYLNYSVKDGLPSNTVYCSFQDSKGYIWLGTDRGVVRYDGYQFTVYTTTDGLADNMVFDIYEDSKNRIWFACNNGNACYYYNHIFYNKKNNAILAQIVTNGPGLKTLEDKDHNIFLLTHFKIYKLSPQNVVTEIEQNQTMLYSSINLNEKNEVVVLSTKGIYNLNTKEGIKFENKSGNAPQLHSKALLYQGKLYYTQTTEIVCNDLNNVNSQTQRFSITSQPYLTQCLQTDQQQQLLVGTQHGLYYWDIAKKQVVSHAFETTSISSILKDKENNLWITSLNNGIYLSVNPSIRLLNNTSGLPFNYCSFIDHFNDGSFAVGSNQFQVAIYRNQQMHHIKLPEQFGEGKVEKIRMDEKGDYYITLGSVLMRVNKNNFSVKVFNIAARDILFDQKKKIYLVAGNSLREVESTDALKQYNSVQDSIDRMSGVNVTHIKASGLYKGPYSNNLYLYGLFGVKTYANQHLHDVLDNDETLTKNIYRVQETPDGLLWLASNIYGVLVIYNHKIIAINNTKGLPSNFINAIHADKQQHIWVASVAGLSKISYSLLDNKFDYRIENYSQSDGLITKNVNDVTTSGDDIYIATEEGVCIFSEKDLKMSVSKPILNIESFYFNDQLAPLSTNYSSNYKTNSVKIKFVGLSFRSFGKIRYRYRMKGLEDTWSVTNNTMLEYPALPPGKYEFELMAVNAKGVQSAIKSISIQIHPPFWRTTWFVVLACLLTVLLLYYFLQKRIASMQKQHAITEQLLNLENQQLEAQKKQIVYEKELLDIKHQALRLHMNPHFIFNAINAIQGFYASGEIEKAKTYIGKFSGLLRMILDQSSKEFIDLNEEVKTITYYLDLNTLRFENKFSYNLMVDESLLLHHEEIPPMLIQPVIENAIIHAIAPMKSMGKITIRILDDAPYIRCEIEDNGVGRAFSYHLNKDRKYNSTGIHVTQKRLDLLNANAQKLPIEQCKIIDLYDDDGAPMGTKVVFYVLKNSI